MTAPSPAKAARPVYTNIGKALGTDYFLLKADLTAGMTALPTWMRVFLKSFIESDPGVRGRHIDDNRDDADHVGADHDRHRQRRKSGDDDQRHAAVVRAKPKPLSTQKKRAAKRGATRAVKV